ncbi:major facilitator superfamily domain-containing protein [Pisolithus thermaeus]|nr:major facilitator superfamily domain-containing protein [Pisolithus croceorrhizus]KAI6160926.1 major facilitator superfamily domain-containing protein [Pisolithus thermaeus]
MASLTDTRHDDPGLLSARRIITLLGSILVALSSGTNYIFSAYAPQLGARLHISHTQLNVVGLAGNIGVFASGPIWGRIVDSRGPRIPLIGAFMCFLIGYAGMKRMYDAGTDSGTSISAAHFTLLVVCGLLTGLGANAGIASAINTTAKSFPASAHATTTGLVQSGFGLSAFFFSTIAHVFFPGDTSAFLLLLALATSTPILVALFIVRPVPLPPTRPGPRGDEDGDYERIPSGEVAPFITDPIIDVVGIAEQGSRTPLLGSRQGDEPSSTLRLGRSQSCSRPDNPPDIHGKMLWGTLDFYLVSIIMALLSGTGITYINNVGTISLALFAKSNPIYDEVEASKWQAAQVSTLSVGNFVGRVLSGLISDFLRNRLHLPRAYSLCIVSSLFIISQALAIGISSVSTLWIATATLGVAYGGLFGALPAIVIDWFGLAHLSENWGYVTLAPLVGGNIFSIMFGRNLDAHTPHEEDTSRNATRFVGGEISSEERCLIGRECYVSSLRVTLVACMVALALSTWAATRDERRRRAVRKERTDERDRDL